MGRLAENPPRTWPLTILEHDAVIVQVDLTLSADGPYTPAIVRLEPGLSADSRVVSVILQVEPTLSAGGPYTWLVVRLEAPLSEGG